MRDPIMTIVGLLVFGVVGFGVWYASMLVDNQFADVLRRESRKGWFWRNIEAVCVPIFSVVMVLGGNRADSRGDGCSRMAPVLHGSFDAVSHGAGCQLVPAHQIPRSFLP